MTTGLFICTTWGLVFRIYYEGVVAREDHLSRCFADSFLLLNDRTWVATTIPKRIKLLYSRLVILFSTIIWRCWKPPVSFFDSIFYWGRYFRLSLLFLFVRPCADLKTYLSLFCLLVPQGGLWLQKILVRRRQVNVQLRLICCNNRLFLSLLKVVLENSRASSKGLWGEQLIIGQLSNLLVQIILII